MIKNALRLSLALVISEAREAAAGGESKAAVAGDAEPQVACRPWRLTQEVIVDTIKMCMEFNSELAVANPF